MYFYEFGVSDYDESHIIPLSYDKELTISEYEDLCMSAFALAFRDLSKRGFYDIEVRGLLYSAVKYLLEWGFKELTITHNYTQWNAKLFALPQRTELEQFIQKNHPEIIERYLAREND